MPFHSHIRTPAKRRAGRVLSLILAILTAPRRILGKTRNSPASTPSPPRRILIARLDQIGDVIMATPAIHALRQHFPNAQIDLLCGSWAVDIVKGNPDISEVIPFDCPWWVPGPHHWMTTLDSLRRLPGLIRLLQQRHYDIFIDLRGDMRLSYLFGWLTGIPVRIGSIRSGGSFLLTHPVPYREGVHEVHRNFNVIAALGVPACSPVPIVKYSSADSSRAQRILGAAGITVGAFIVVFNGGRSPLRHIPTATLAQACARLLREKTWGLVIVGGKKDAPEAQHLAEDIRSIMTTDLHQPILNLCGEITLLETTAIISLAALFIGSDSSVTHLAASTGTPIVAVYGPTVPDECGPLTENSIKLYHRYPCSPCLQTHCLVTKEPRTAACMNSILPEEICHAAEEVQKSPPTLGIP